MRFFLIIAACAAILAPHTAQADSSPPVMLASCRAAALEAGDDPTRFPCNWSSVLKGAAGGALTGKFSIQQKGVRGTLSILEGGGGPALIAIRTVERAGGFVCRVKTSGTREPSDVLVARPSDAPGCVIRIVSSGRNVVRVGSEGCQAFCGRRIGFDGTYKLSVR